MSFAEVHAAHPWDDVLGSVAAKTDADVLRALARAEADAADLEDFNALISLPPPRRISNAWPA
jgi:hypothetical protein